jgi:hypothetical protein
VPSGLQPDALPTLSYNGATTMAGAASSGLEPELPGTKIRWASDYPTRHRVSLLTRQDSNLNRLIQNQPCYRLHHGSSVRAEGFEPPVPQGRLLYRQLRLTIFASHAWHHRLPEQDSNLQSRINNPLVYRLTDRGLRRRERAGVQTPPLAMPLEPARSRLIKRAPGPARTGICHAPSARTARGSWSSRPPAASGHP